MYLNCSQFVNVTYIPPVLNLSDHLVQALDIYFISEDADYYYKSLEPITEGTNAGLSKFSIKIDGNIYPIKKDSPGESPLNPIVYKKDNTISRVNFKNKQGIIFASAFAGIDIEEDGFTFDDWERNTNFNAEDFITIEIIENEPPVDFKKLYGYGAGRTVEDPDRCPYSGYRDDLLIGYGGYGFDQLVAKMQIVIEESSINRKNFSYLYNGEA